MSKKKKIKTAPKTINVYNLIVLDESGSMYDIKDVTITGFNEIVQTSKALNKEFKNQNHLVSFYTFNGSGIKQHMDKADANEVVELNNDTYQPDANTPLYDALGKSINELAPFVKKNDKVLVTILTDGYENASEEYAIATINKLIGDKKKEGWIFNYIGADHDVETTAMSMNITNFMVFEKHASSTTLALKTNTNAKRRWAERINNSETSSGEELFYTQAEKEEVKKA